jgi:hypothetical protein
LDPSDRISDEEVLLTIASIIKNIGIPEEWLISRLMLVSKTSDPFPRLGKHRPISINSIPLKVAERIIKAAMDKCQTCEIQMGKYQTGFRKNGDPRYNVIEVLKHVANKERILSIDLTSAFDSISRKLLVK